jgi:hypothetical protein
MAARVLAESVTVLERDHIESSPAVHKSIPQVTMSTGLLVGGQRAMLSFYPNLSQFGEIGLDPLPYIHSSGNSCYLSIKRRTEECHESLSSICVAIALKKKNTLIRTAANH